MIELHVIGAGPAYSNVPGSVGSAYLIRSGDKGLVLDLGQGTFPGLAAAFDPRLLSAVLISHLHPDHFIDLIPLRHYLRRPELQPTPPVRLLAPAGIADRVDGVFGEPGFTAAALGVERLEPGAVALDGFRVEVARVTHAGESCAFRVADSETGPGVVYSGDCADAAGLRPLVRAGDVLLCEATLGPGPVPPGMPHLDGPTVGALAAESRASHVVVTHVRLGCDLDATLASVRAVFPGAVSLAVPGFRTVV
jgi:ribonuclease BN (tRNA processing enzyme)